MPNFVKNKIIVTKENLKIIKNKYIRLNEETLKYEFDFNLVIKRPSSLDIEYSSKSIKALQIYLTYINPNILYYGSEEVKYSLNEFNMLLNRIKEKGYINKEYIISEEEINKVKDIKNLLELGKIQIDNLYKYDSINWYDWSIENWGTKWNSDNLEICENYITFETAWSPSINVILEMSKQNEGIKFAYLYSDENIGCNTGYLLVSNGKIDFKGNFKDFSIDAYKLAFDLWECEDEYVYDEKEKTYVYSNN